MRGTGVIWPVGYSARREGGKIVLLNPAGNIVAREGDLVSMGNPPENGIVHPCTPIEVRATAQP